MLDPDVRRDLRSLAKDTAELVAKHLVRTGQLIDEDPTAALAHARAASALAGRVAAVREAAGLAAYAAGEWREAMSELRTARRLSGSPEHLAVLADCERGLGRPERALALLEDPEVPRLDEASRAELLIVASGARRDMGQPGAAVLVLRDAARAVPARQPWAVRLWYSYADALEADGREEEAAEWFTKAASADLAGETDADERLLVLQGVSFDGEEDVEAADEGAEGPAETSEPSGREVVDPEIDALLAQLTERSRAKGAPSDAADVRPGPDDADATNSPEATPPAVVEPSTGSSSGAPGVLFQAEALSVTDGSPQGDKSPEDRLF